MIGLRASQAKPVDPVDDRAARRTQEGGGRDGSQEGVLAFDHSPKRARVLMESSCDRESSILG